MTMGLFMKPEPCHLWSITYTGRRFWPAEPNPADICIEDIAHSLAHQCRFGGHTRMFYSVAQHSVIVSEIHAEDPFKGLMHDATEAYCADLMRPLKVQLPEYNRIEAGVWAAVCSRFGMTTELSESLKTADNIALMTERRDLIQMNGYRWVYHLEIIKPLDKPIKCWKPEEAEHRFLSRFYELYED